MHIYKKQWEAAIGEELECMEIASFPGPRPASRRLQYGSTEILLGHCKRREAGRGPGNEASMEMQ